jgi:hypothetical protein
MEAPGDNAPANITSQGIRIGKPSLEIKVRASRSPIIATNIKIKSNKII